jgi:hypothetical protein
LNDTYHITDTAPDILSHPGRKNRIHILTLDSILATDVYERIHRHPGMKHYRLIRPKQTQVQETVVEIDSMARQTVSARLLIIDVRKATLPMLQRAYNKIVGYNRRDFNKLCYTILIGDGPASLFQAGKSLDVFISHLSKHRIDYHPAVFFYDPFLHYEPDEIQPQRIHEKLSLPDKIPKRLVPYFTTGQDMTVDQVRRFFRAAGKSEHVRNERLTILKALYEKRVAEQFPHHRDQLKPWLSREGIRVATERLHLYPLFFEDWVYYLMKKAAKG